MTLAGPNRQTTSCSFYVGIVCTETDFQTEFIAAKRTADIRGAAKHSKQQQQQPLSQPTQAIYALFATKRTTTNHDDKQLHADKV